ncbi:MAG: hypothetical protein ALECFALPRED_000385 [Alectoria fallacina]|uniref:Uncharacterized protein n=1 Tax=Alectoria fallacina TaxID=1903189 RepID=A0A8H3IEJ5_9LECA|nr:MAG: hypothetical protein ALECFALPRED_000385 [Alectoria fallacina]
MSSMWHNKLFPIAEWTLLYVFLVNSAIASPNPLQVNPPLCDKDLFGAPKLEDCYQAMFWIPYINQPAKDSPDAKAFRVFAEPQFLNPPFSAVKNPYAPKAIVQLPKIWKHGSCQIALVLQPYDRRDGRPPQLKPEFREKWSDVVNQVLRLRPCLQPQRGLEQTPQGGYTALIITQSRLAGLYMYTTDSRFNTETMTPYMANGKMIEPPITPRFLATLPSNGTFSGLSLDLSNSSGEISSTPMLDLLPIS